MNRKLTLGIGLIGGIAVIAVAVFAVWFFVLREDGPEEVSTASALEALARATTTPTGASDDSESTATRSSGQEAATPTIGNTDAASEGLDGTWQVDTTLDSFVGYRVQEQLAGVGGVEAVGRTRGVTGSVTIEGLTASEGSITADMTQLRSNESNRDNQLRTQGIEFGRFPTSEFTLTQPVDLPEAVQEGETVQVTLVGELTLHGVTKEIQVPSEVTYQDGVLVAVGQVQVLFADFDISKPRSQRVLGIEDTAVMELQLFFRRG